MFTGAELKHDLWVGIYGTVGWWLHALWKWYKHTFWIGFKAMVDFMKVNGRKPTPEEKAVIMQKINAQLVSELQTKLDAAAA